MIFGIILVTGATLTTSILLMQVAVLPLMFRYSKSVQRKMVFSNCINYPRHLDYSRPSSCNIDGGRNFYIDFHSKVDSCPIKLGVWHIVPSSVSRKLLPTRDCETIEADLHRELKMTKNTVVLYCHGNSNHRASHHRLLIYNVLQDLDFHVITFDYRGYGDSTRVRPTEHGVVEDTFLVYCWLMNSIESDVKPTVLLWGHSLGTAVAASLVAHFKELCRDLDKPALSYPDALVLEAAFNNLTEEIKSHPFSKLVSWLPYYKDMFVKPFSVSSEYAFTTDQYLTSTPHVPILMLHSRGDKIVPYELAVKLHQELEDSRKASGGQLVFHSFDRGLGLGHNNLCEASNFKAVIAYVDFMKYICRNVQ